MAQDAPDNTDISTLMGMDPLGLSDQDISTIVEALRANRHRFLAGNAKAGSMKPKTKTVKQKAAEKSASIIGDITGDLGL